MSSGKPHRRRRDRREDEVDASQGKLGPGEYREVDCCMKNAKRNKKKSSSHLSSNMQLDTSDFDEEVLQRDGGGALTISEVRLLLLRAVDTEREEGLGRDPMQIP